MSKPLPAGRADPLAPPGSIDRPRRPEHPVHPWFVDRWSPRAFGDEPLARTTLFSLFEAARWAPSSGNAQPWHFIYALRDSDRWPALRDLLSERNRAWAGRAAALVVLVSQTLRVRAGETSPTRLRSHAFDAGAAWQSLALQAHALGWHTRGMGGFDREAACRELGIPADHEPQIVIAIGRRAEASVLPVEWAEQERPNSRRPLRDIVSEGRFGGAADLAA